MEEGKGADTTFFLKALLLSARKTRAEKEMVDLVKAFGTFTLQEIRAFSLFTSLYRESFHKGKVLYNRREIINGIIDNARKLNKTWKEQREEIFLSSNYTTTHGIVRHLIQRGWIIKDSPEEEKVAYPELILGEPRFSRKRYLFFPHRIRKPDGTFYNLEEAERIISGFAIQRLRKGRDRRESTPKEPESIRKALREELELLFPKCSDFLPLAFTNEDIKHCEVIKK